MPEKITAVVSPTGSLNRLSQYEVARLRDANDGGLNELFRRCCLAVLNCGREQDDPLALLEDYRDFEVRILQRDRGVALELVNAPAEAFVGDKMILGVREHLYAVLRDVLYVSGAPGVAGDLDLGTSEGITNFVFHLLRNAGAFVPRRSDVVVCWGGHSINRVEYEYTKEVGYHLGLHRLDICTGCGAGAMKGPMKGAAVGHLKQRVGRGRYIGLTEPGIIASESPNPVVNELIILPDIEKRLEAFVRLGHAFVVFPGGVGTAEEILFLLAVLMHPDNAGLPFPLIFTGPAGSEAYFEQIDRFITTTLGEAARRHYRIVVGDPPAVAALAAEGVAEVHEYRRAHSDAFYFNWSLRVEFDLQQPFDPSHENMAALDLRLDQPRHRLAYHLRRAFSGIVAGNVKAQGIERVRERGPFLLRGEKRLLDELDRLLESFVRDGRMRLPGKQYHPCYRLEAA
ncbi:MAG: hypothetical protein KatS3mg121_0683 [Gammaproteobacteria bacterium]|nr:MAG: hypothetical protein KatS3mg121_0683 [Gammaproteobacteria bacterium]